MKALIVDTIKENARSALPQTDWNCNFALGRIMAQRSPSVVSFQDSLDGVYLVFDKVEKYHPIRETNETDPFGVAELIANTGELNLFLRPTFEQMLAKIYHRRKRIIDTRLPSLSKKNQQKGYHQAELIWHYHH